MPKRSFSEASLGESFSNLEPARVQFIEKIFGDMLAQANAAFSQSRAERIRWVHDRLFRDGSPAHAVLAELEQLVRPVTVIAVTSGKGGVGKTTFSVNLAVALAQLGRRVLLFDADFGMANVHVFAGVNPRTTLLDVIDGRASLPEILTAGPAGIKIACGASGVGRLADLSPRVLEALGREVLRCAADFDVLLIDTGAGISASVTQFLALAQDAIVIATPNLASTLDAYGLIKAAHEARIGARMHVVINQTDEESQAAKVLVRIAGCAERFLGFSPESLGFLGRDPAFEFSCQQRQPLILAQPQNVNAQRIAKIAARFFPPAAPAAPAARGADEAAGNLTTAAQPQRDFQARNRHPNRSHEYTVRSI